MNCSLKTTDLNTLSSLKLTMKEVLDDRTNF